MKESVEFRGITKIFPGVKALNNVSFKVEGGEVVALMGENGAGKSTLLKVLNGDYQPEEGTLLVNGEEKNFKTPQDAIRNGISIIYQERNIIPYLSVAENIFMEELPLKNSRLINFKTLNAKTQEIIDEFNLPIIANSKVKDLSVAHQQMVEIMKSYRRNPKIIAFDEPTASLSDAEIDSLFKIIEKLKTKGIIILYVSHRMKEIFQIADRVIVMKDGCYVDEVLTSNSSEKEIVKLMVGRNLGDVFNELERATIDEKVVLKVDNLTNEYIKDISFELKKGEVLGFAGLVGAGRTETMQGIFGIDTIYSGKIYLDGKEVVIKAPEDAIRYGLALCPEDRKEQGIVAGRSIKDNISMAILKRILKRGFIDKERENKIAQESVEQLNIRTPNIYKKIGELSGGNQQKVILARWLASNPKVLILDEPTKGIDVGAKSEIYKIICKLAKKGIGIIVISSELPEVMGISDRIIVMCQGSISGELKREEATDEKILTLAMADMLGGK